MTKHAATAAEASGSHTETCRHHLRIPDCKQTPVQGAPTNQQPRHWSDDDARMGGWMITDSGVLQHLAHTIDADTARWWGYALSCHEGQWTATVVPATQDDRPLAHGTSSDEQQDLMGPNDLEDVLGPSLVQALAFLATTLGAPAPQVSQRDPDLEALHALMTTEEITSLVVAYDAVVDGVTEHDWEVYGSGGGGAFCANGATYPEAIDAVSTRR